MLQDPKKFFGAARVELFGSAIEQAQVDGINGILDAWPEGTDPRFVAYALATAYHETARTMQPIAEWGRGQGKPYGVATGPYQQRYYGRGLVQLTWLVNYQKAAQRIPGSDLVRTPDNALKPTIAAKIMVCGMSEGWFTGKKLGDYFSEGRTDWLRAREIINGLDCAAEIAGYAVKFFHAIDAAKESAEPTPSPPPLAGEVAAKRREGAAPDLSTVKAVQAALASLHFAIDVDGDAGPETQDVIRAFRAIVGLPAGTEADDAMKAALAKALAA